MTVFLYFSLILKEKMIVGRMGNLHTLFGEQK
jgi:hypothetical protein